jgi:hypothetical protein
VETGQLQESSASFVSRLASHVSRFSALDALLFLFILNLVLQPLVEPDFGWHLRAGLDFLQSGGRLPATDPYSHTMPDWPWVEHAWLTDAVLAWLYTTAGPLAVIVCFAVVTAGAFLLASRTDAAGLTSRLLAVLACLWVALPFLGARTQMISLLGLAAVLWVAGRPCVLWALPPLFLLWANLHGGFMAGLFVLALIAVASAALCLLGRQNRFNRAEARPGRLDIWESTWTSVGRLTLVTIVSALVTLINPYGWRLHEEIVLSLTDREMIEILHEWQPVSLEQRAGVLFLAYVLAFGVLGALVCRRAQPNRWTLVVVFLLLSLRHWRNVPLFLLVSVPLAAEWLAASGARLRELLRARLPGVARAPKRAQLAAAVLAVLLLASLGSGHLERVVFCGLDPPGFFRGTSYPIEAVQWIREHRALLGERLYNDYGVGGFLLWWLPEEKIFIDGRMPAWRIGDRRILSDYVALTAGDPPALGVLDKYRVEWALVERKAHLDRRLEDHPGWGRVYEDAKVAVYVRR